MSDTRRSINIVNKINEIWFEDNEQEIIDLLFSKETFVAIIGQLSKKYPNMTGDQLTKILNDHGFKK